MSGVALRHRLQAPEQVISVEDLAQAWFQTDITVTVEAAGAFAADPALTDRIRGAFGRALMEGASAASLHEELCPWTPPCTHDVLWNPKGAVRRGVDIAKPFRLRVWASVDGALCVRVSLFGLASDWAEPAAEAMVRAFRNGVALSGGQRQGWTVAERKIASAEPFPDSPFCGEPSNSVGVVLAFQTPFFFCGRGRAPLDPLALLSGLSRRAEGMARWHDAHLRVDGHGLAEAAARLSCQSSQVRPYHRLRPANRNRTKGIPLDGYVGPYALFAPQDVMTSLWPLLSLGTAFGAGARTSLGFGDYGLSPLVGAPPPPATVEDEYQTSKLSPDYS